ncbi:MAG: hypothetical protein CMH98_04730 [Oceanospirillaceae bacterium]|nr:hypothetical protein [Oceanospirillaceae bacterium]
MPIYVPIDVQHIIQEYVQCFQQVDYQIEECINCYFAIEHRANTILEIFCIHRNPLKCIEIRQRVDDVIGEASRLIDVMLIDQMCLPVHKSMLSFLISELTVDSFKLYLTPIRPAILPYSLYTSEHDSDEYEDSDDNVPQLL